MNKNNQLQIRNSTVETNQKGNLCKNCTSSKQKAKSK